MIKPPSRLPLYVGLALIVTGWGVIFAGWYQAARQELEAGQLPYVISGGFGGLGLLLLGATGIVVYVVQRAGWGQQGVLNQLAQRVVAEEEARDRHEDAATPLPTEISERPRRKRGAARG